MKSFQWERTVEDGYGGQRRLGEGQNDLPPDAQAGGAVDIGGLVVVVGQGKVELAQEKDVEGAAAKKGGHGQGQEGIDPAQAGKENEGGDQGNDAGQHHGREQHGEEEVPLGKAAAGEAEGDQAGRDDGAEGCQAGDDERVAQVEEEGELLDGHEIVRPDEGARISSADRRRSAACL